MTEIRTGYLRAFDNINWLATVQITGSLALFLTSVPVSRSLAAIEMPASRKVAVAFFDPSNHTDAVVFAVYT